MRVELLLVPGCPNAEAVRQIVRAAIAETESGADVEEVERVGQHLSPTVLVDGDDVMGPAPLSAGAGCRLDLPTSDRVMAALQVAATRRAEG